MHRVIANAPAELNVDHKDGDGLNNTRANLRIATQKQNSANRRANRGTQYKGIYRNKLRFRAEINTADSRHYLGNFKNAEDAARAYDAKAKELFGEFARTNFL
jgi:hypothetical protein